MSRPRTVRVMVGLPESTGRLPREAGRLCAPVMLSAGRLWRKGRFRRPGRMVWQLGAALDSAGFVAARRGGYRWTVEQYVEAVVTNVGDGAMPFPWVWWSAMDYCCEPEIARNQAEVDRRVDLTVATYGECFEALAYWRDMGVRDVPDPLPILQGWCPADYLRCAEGLANIIDATNPCTCPDGDEWCAATSHRTRRGLPDLVGVGSVCRRHLHGPNGLLAILRALHQALPARVRLHLFGVKGAALPYLAELGDRVASVDSMAWDYAARRSTKGTVTVDLRAEHMRRWYAAQLVAAAAPAQMGLGW